MTHTLEMANGVQGPYWVRVNTNGSHDVCGRNAKVIRNYMPDQLAMADADCRRLMKRFSLEQNLVTQAAPDLLAAAKGLLNSIYERHPGEELRCEHMRALAAAVAKAEAA